MIKHCKSLKFEAFETVNQNIKSLKLCGLHWL